MKALILLVIGYDGMDEVLRLIDEGPLKKIEHPADTKVSLTVYDQARFSSKTLIPVTGGVQVMMVWMRCSG